jgi:lipoprotein-anchoring transpeptidase ErfK/SrfK
MKTLQSLLPLLLIVLLPSCAAMRERNQLKKTEANVPAKQEVTLYEWANPGINGNASVRINLSEQKAHIFDSGKEVAWTYVATGVEGRRTPSGHFDIMEKIADKHSNTWGIIVNGDGDTINSDGNANTSDIPKGCKFVGAPMPHWMRLTGGGIGMHGGYIPDPGQPASHGCIRLPYEMAMLMYENLPEGTPVTISE